MILETTVKLAAMAAAIALVALVAFLFYAALTAAPRDLPHEKRRK